MGAAASDELTPDTREAALRSAAVMSVGTLLSRTTGVVRLSVTLAALGLGRLADTYNAANATPNIVYELVLGGILTSVFVPILVGWTRTHGAEAGHDAGRRFMTLALVVLGALAVLGALLAPAIMAVYLGGVEDPVRRAQEIELGTFFLRWFMPQIVFYGLTAVAGGILTAHRRFAPPMFAPILNNVAVICTMLAFIWLRDGQPPRVATLTPGQQLLLAAGTTLGVAAMAMALWPSLRATGFRWRLRFDWRHETVRRLVRLSGWVFLYVLANQLAYVVIVNLGLRLGDGAFSAYVYAFIFFSLPHAIVAVSIVTALLPGMAERWTDRDPAGVTELFSRGFRDTQVVILPAAIGLVVLAGPIVALFAQFGAVGAADRELLADALAAFAIGLPFFSAFQLLTRTFYATHDSRTPALVNVLAAIAHVSIDLLLAFVLGFGVVGLALGHAASYAIGSIALTMLLRRRLGSIDGPAIRRTVLRALPAAILSGGVALAVAAAFGRIGAIDQPGVRLAQVLAAVAAGVLVFAASASMFGVHEVPEVARALTRRLRR